MPLAVVLNDVQGGEARVAATPATVKRFVGAGLDVMVETGAGLGASMSDDAYVAAGATIAPDATALGRADLVLGVAVPTAERIGAMRAGAALVSHLWAAANVDVVKALMTQKVDAFAMDNIPRITRAQSSDARSSQANIAGYKAVVMAAERMPRVMPMMMTAAGTIRPAKVVIIGAGVAGLQAIATARRLGAVVEVSDVRPEVEEQVQSLGATYIKVETTENLVGEGGYAAEQSDAFRALQQQTLERHLVAADAIICTAAIPYRTSPVVVSEEVVQKMRAGSVIVDLAAEGGGNCALTEPGAEIVRHGVTIVGTLDVPSLVPVHSSEMYANNVRNVVLDNVVEGAFAWNLEDDIVAGALVTHAGEVRLERVRQAMEGT